MSVRRRAASLLLAVALTLPTFFLPLASAGLLGSFVEGPSVTLQAGGPPSPATLQFPNPSRAVDARFDVSTVPLTRNVSLPGPSAAEWVEKSVCPTLLEPISEFAGAPLNASELFVISSLDGLNWTQPSTAFGCGLLVVSFNATAALDPFGAPFLEARFEVAADADAAAGQSNITLAVWETPPVGRPGWRLVPLTPSISAQGAFEGTVVHPPLRAQGAARLLDAVLFCTDGGHLLTVDEVSVSFSLPEDPVSPTVVVSPPGIPVWQFRGPRGEDALFGRTLTDGAGGTSAWIPSIGAAADGFTGPLFVPEGAQVRRAFVDLLPDPFADGRANASGATTFTANPLSATTLPYPPAVEGFPIYARPTRGTITLYGLVAHGVPDAEQTTLSTSSPVGNYTSFERSAAQTFAATQDGAIEAIELSLADATGHPVGPLILEIHTTTAGAPDDAVLATASVNASQARAGGWVNFTFSPAVPIAQGQVLAAVLASPGSAASETWDWRGHNGVATDPYTGGTASISASANGSGPWANLSNVDMGFRVFLTTPFNPSLAPFVLPAGASGAPTVTANYSGPFTGWTYEVPGAAVGLVPDFQGGGRWEVPVVNGLTFAVEFRWDAALEFDINPRAVELAVGNRSALVTLAELSRPQVVEITAELQAALVAGEYTEIVTGPVRFWLLSLRVHADGPANVTVSGFDIGYDATVTVTGLAAPLNAALALVPQGGPPVTLQMGVLAPAGGVRLSALSIFYSEPPFSPPIIQPPFPVPEGAVNRTVVDLLQWFIDDYGPLALTFSVDSVVPPVAFAAVHRSAIDANLTVTMLDAEYHGPLTITARAIDGTGLPGTRAFNVTVIQVDDAPRILPLQDVILDNTTGVLDLAPFISDDDTLAQTLVLSESSVFAALSGFNLTFDYREAPASFSSETLTISVFDGTTNVSAPLRVFINNAGRPVITAPPPQTLVVGHNATVALDDLVADDRDSDSALVWGVLLSTGTGATPGSSGAQIVPGRLLALSPFTPGDTVVNLSVRDTDGNLGLGQLRFHIVANQAPSLARLAGTNWTLPQGAELRIALSDYLVDADDVVANFSFTRVWSNGELASVSVEGGVLVVRRLGEAGGTVNVTLVATDPAGATTMAEFVVAVEGTPAGAASVFLLPLLLFVVLGGIGALLFLSYRKGKARGPTLGALEREEAEADEDEDGAEGGAAKAGKRLESPEGLDDAAKDPILESLDRMEHEADAPRVELPPVTLFGVPNALATTLILLYRDGRPISWVSNSSPSEEDTEKGQELAAAFGEWVRKAPAGDRQEWATVEAGGRKLAVEGRAQLFLGAVLEPSADEAIVRVNMRAALDKAFDGNAEALKRWNGSRAGLKGVDDALERVLKR